MIQIIQKYLDKIVKMIPSYTTQTLFNSFTLYRYNICNIDLNTHLEFKFPCNLDIVFNYVTIINIK